MTGNRSVLYNIEPIGKGTSYIESLSSYIKRLAYVHYVTPGSLLHKVIVPKINKYYLSQISQNGGDGFTNLLMLLMG